MADGSCADSEYARFIAQKSQGGETHGFEPLWLPSFLFDFQSELVSWALRQGRAALFADCGMGKTAMLLVWGENVVRRTGGRVLVLTPLAVVGQTLAEAAKFGVEARRSNDGTAHDGITVTNYEKLHLFNPSDFVGVVCDESSILKSFEGVTRATVTEFLRLMPYRLLDTATAAPNDYVELGTHSEALGYLGHSDMLTRFFRSDTGTALAEGGQVKMRFKGHAEEPFWRWVCSWARALRRPSDLGFDDSEFVLPELIEREHRVGARRPREGMLFSVPAHGLTEQREERRRTVRERCETAAALVVDTGESAVCWCHLNDEGDLLERLIPGAVQVSGRDADEAKEEKFRAFAAGEARVLVLKPVIGAWGLNWQHCAHMTTFATHSFEQHYQSVRRLWRYGQKRNVTVDHVVSDGEGPVLANLRRKSEQAEVMFSRLVRHMRDGMAVARDQTFPKKEQVPSWL